MKPIVRSLLRVTGSFLFLFLVLATRQSAFAQETVVVETDKELAAKAGDRFIEQYKKTLDLNPILDEMGSSLIATEWRDTRILEDFRFDPQLLQRVDDKAVRRVFKAFFNTYFTGMLYMYQFPESNDGDGSKILPDDFRAVLKKSRFRSIVINAGEIDPIDKKNKYLVTTEADIEEYIGLNNTLAAVLKKHLPPKPFETAMYKKRYEDFGRYEHEVAVTKTSFSDDKKNGPLYIVHREFFTIYFVKENEAMKILTFGIGN